MKVWKVSNVRMALHALTVWKVRGRCWVGVQRVWLLLHAAACVGRVEVRAVWEGWKARGGCTVRKSSGSCWRSGRCWQVWQVLGVWNVRKVWKARQARRVCKAWKVWPEVAVAVFGVGCGRSGDVRAAWKDSKALRVF